MSEDRIEYVAPRPVCEVDFDEAYYLGDGENGCYFDAAQGPGGWYMSVVVDTEHFTDTIYQDDGPYMTRKNAVAAARMVAIDWCQTNDVDWVSDL